MMNNITESVAVDLNNKVVYFPPTINNILNLKLIITNLQIPIIHYSHDYSIKSHKAELTLDEMAMGNSTYIQESRLKKKFEKTWKKLCKVLGRPPNTGRVVEKRIHASTTGYSMIDKAVAKFLKEKRGSFPDFFDIRDVVHKANKKHDLRMSPQVLNGIIADIFTDIGNKLQRQRERDLLFNFGSRLLDDFKSENDPALSNEDLANKLANNRRISKRNLKHVYAKYTHLERYEIDDKFQKAGFSRVYKYTDSDSSTSDDEQDDKSSKSKQDRKSKMKESKEVDMDSSDSSENEEDISRIENDDSMITIEDSEIPSSQEYSFINVTSKASTDVSLSASHMEQSFSDTVQVKASLSNNEHPKSPTFPVLKWHERGRPDETVSSFHLDCTNSATTTNCDCEIISDSNELKQLATPANKPLVSELVTNINHDCELVNELVIMKPVNESVNNPSVNKPPNTDDECEIVVDPKRQLPTMTQVEKPTNEHVNELPGFEVRPNIDDECEIVDDPKQHLPTMTQVKEPVNEHVKEPPPSEEQPNIDDECEIVDDPKQHLPTMTQVEEPVNEHVKEPPGFEEQLNTDDECEIVNDPKEQLASIKQPKTPANEQFNKPSPPPPNTDDDCLIIDDNQDHPPSTTSHGDPLKIPTSTPSDNLTRTLNVLREVFRKRSNSVDQSKLPLSSSDDSVSASLHDRSCETEHLKSATSNTSVSQSVTSKVQSSENTSENIKIRACKNSYPMPKSVTYFSDDIILSEIDQSSTSDSLNDCIEVLTNCSSSPPRTSSIIPRTSNNSPSKHNNTDKDNQFGQSTSSETTHNEVKTITSESCQTPSSFTLGASETVNTINPRKRKATSELTVTVKKSSVEYLEQIAWSLKNKKLKLPHAWVSSWEKNSRTSKATTPKESSTVKNASIEPTTSKHSSAAGQTASANNVQVTSGKAKIDSQHKHVFRERTLNAFQVPAKSVCNNNINSCVKVVDSSPSSEIVSVLASDSVDNEDKLEVIIIDD